jgi:hypothetical protein
MLVKVLGAIDLLAALVFLMLTFGVPIFTPLLLFCAALLLIKSFFIFSGDVLSVIDMLAALFLVISIFATLPTILLWLPAFFLLAKGVASFF